MVYAYGGRKITERDIPDPEKRMKMQKCQSRFLTCGSAVQCLSHYGMPLTGIFVNSEEKLHEIGLSLYWNEHFALSLLEKFYNVVTYHRCIAS